MSEPAILAVKLIGPHKRFKVTKFQTRFDTIEWFAADAEGISDAAVRAGQSAEPFAQGDLRGVAKAVAARWAADKSVDRKVKEVLHYRHKHSDYKGKLGGKPSVLVLRNGGTTLVQVAGLTDAELDSDLPYNLTLEVERLVARA